MVSGVGNVGNASEDVRSKVRDMTITTGVGVTADIGIQLAGTFDGNNSPGHGRGASSNRGQGVPTISAR